MKKMQIFEPPMCCNTGISGVGIDPELMRISAVMKAMMKNNIVVDRFNLSNAPMAFVENTEVNEFINTTGVDGLPVVTLDGKIVIQGRYPTNEEFAEMLGVSANIFGEQPKILKIKNL